MKRFLISTATALALWQTPALAGSEIVNPIISRIEAEGYAVSDATRTWLGRIVITAQKGESLREVVLNRTTGEVLRDRLFPTRATDPEAESRDKDRSGGDDGHGGRDRGRGDGNGNDDNADGDGEGGGGGGGDGEGGGGGGGHGGGGGGGGDGEGGGGGGGGGGDSD